MRFDDSLSTVLAADTSTVFGARTAFRQLVDLIGRGRAPDDEKAIGRLRLLRDKVPLETRAASARALALTNPGPALIAFFAEDAPAVVAPVLRTARINDDAWRALLPRLGPVARGILRQRDDLSAGVKRALASFGSVDFTLHHDAPVSTPADQPATPPVGAGPFVTVGQVARELPVVAEALRTAAEPAEPEVAPRFEISDLVARIAAYQKRRSDAAPAAAVPPSAGDRFRFETDAQGVIRWVEGVARGAIVGIDLASVGAGAIDGVVAGAFRRRAAFSDARLTAGGNGPAAGSWRISAVPAFDPASGRFIGYRGGARRPRADEDADPRRGDGVASESLRRLVHELRTPTNAIAGFSELIESELLGPVDPAYRARAAAIRGHVADLIAAIDDLDLAARIEGDALELRGGNVPVGGLLIGVLRDLEPLARLRGCIVALHTPDPALSIAGDDRTVERLVARLLATVVSAGAAGERIAVTAAREDVHIVLAIDRPCALAAVPDATLLTIDAEGEAALPGAPLLGTGFALRLARNLAAELGGGLVFGPDRLTLRLPAALDAIMEQASTR